MAVAGEGTAVRILRGRRSTVGSLIDFVWLEKAYCGPQFTDTCMKHRGVRFHRIRNGQPVLFQRYYFKLYYLNVAVCFSFFALCLRCRLGLRFCLLAALTLMFEVRLARFVDGRLEIRSRLRQGAQGLGEELQGDLLRWPASQPASQSASQPASRPASQPASQPATTDSPGYCRACPLELLAKRLGHRAFSRLSLRVPPSADLQPLSKVEPCDS